MGFTTYAGVWSTFLRIAIDGRYIQDRFPGIGRYTYNLIRALGELGTEELVVPYNPAARNTRYDVAALGALPGVRLVPSATATVSPAEQWHLPLAARRLALSVFHSPYYLKPYVLPCPSLVNVYDLVSTRYPRSMPSRGKRLLFRLTTWLACRTSRAVITVSESSRRDLVRSLRLPPEKVHVTSLAADDCFRPQPAAETARVRRKYGLPDRYVLYFGSDKPHKNLSRLVEAWAQVRSKARARTDGDVKLVLAGYQDPRYSQARERARALGVLDSVVFTGDVAERDAPALYSGAALFVFPSLYEGFGLPVVEAMACGMPVVCSNTSSLPEVAGGAALLVDPTDASALADAIDRALEDQRLRTELRDRGLARASNFSWDATAAATYQVYRVAGQ